MADSDEGTDTARKLRSLVSQLILEGSPSRIYRRSHLGYNAEKTEGVLLHIGRKWLTFGDIWNGHTFDGITLMRVSMIDAVKRFRSEEAEYLKRATALDGSWPGLGSVSHLQLDSTRTLIRSLFERHAGLIEFETKQDSNSIWVGRITEVFDNYFDLLEITHYGSWEAMPTRVQYAQLARISLNTAYTAALAAAGDPQPEV